MGAIAAESHSGGEHSHATRGACGLAGAARARMLASMERQTAKGRCIECGAPTERWSNALRCAVCTGREGASQARGAGRGDCGARAAFMRRMWARHRRTANNRPALYRVRSDSCAA